MMMFTTIPRASGFFKERVARKRAVATDQAARLLGSSQVFGGSLCACVLLVHVSFWVMTWILKDETPQVAM